MKPGPLGYHRATSVPHAVQLLSAYEGTARVIAGGQSLVPMLNMRLIQPDALIDVNGVAELAGIRTAGDTTVLGALVRYTAIEESPLIADRLGLLPRMVRHVGDRQVRNRGTIGGSLAQGDPTGEMPLACLVLGARVTLTGPGGRREVPVADLYLGSYATVLEPCEVLTEVAFPRAPGPLRVRRAVPPAQRLRGGERRGRRGPRPGRPVGRGPGGPGRRRRPAGPGRRRGRGRVRLLADG